MFKKKENHILLITIILVAVGLFTLFSASLTYLQNPESFYKIISFQIFAILAGFFGIFIILKNKKINYSTIRKNSI
jgi:cell division protein FtsW (lipid II flippase)